MIYHLDWIVSNIIIYIIYSNNYVDWQVPNLPAELFFFTYILSSPKRRIFMAYWSLSPPSQPRKLFFKHYWGNLVTTLNLLIQSDFPIALPSLTKTLPNEPDRTQQNHIYPVAFFFFFKGTCIFLVTVTEFSQPIFTFKIFIWILGYSFATSECSSSCFLTDRCELHSQLLSHSFRRDRWVSPHFLLHLEVHIFMLCPVLPFIFWLLSSMAGVKRLI